MNCKLCLNLTPHGSCRVEDDALDRIKGRLTLPMDPTKRQYFEIMLDLFMQMNEDDDDAFYGRFCCFFMERQETKQKQGVA